MKCFPLDQWEAHRHPFHQKSPSWDENACKAAMAYTFTGPLSRSSFSVGKRASEMGVREVGFCAIQR
ncbi:hypothetical protein ANN_24156 [Periplaneta americana]|uniref:Uncharacterized protein n=1 Tax=Periplaneta americana TaxID=6978 RepID=A0ABQ8S2C5_PERAM|nr:hypothetical protein ANN_24156 [Periplaneta americana]